jgi:hypothetical protein
MSEEKNAQGNVASVWEGIMHVNGCRRENSLSDVQVEVSTLMRPD